MINLIRTVLSTILKGKDWIEKLPTSYIFLTSRYHWYNMVSPSPWPILIGITSFPGAVGLVGTMHGIINGLELFISSFITFLFFFCMWNRDIIRESTFIGLHTKQVDKNTITGFKLFLFSEIMLFVTFFWAHLYSALYPSVFIGLSWPPVGLSHLLLDPFDIPWTNTLILVYSGLTVTVSHLYLRRGNIWLSGWAMFATIVLGLAFLYIQKEEFVNSEFDISDGIYGSTFFMLTGFHGGHVIIGVTGLIVTLIRLIELHFSSYSHTGFKLALIYWHFVDVVWIFVFLIVYVLGSDLTFFNAVFTTTVNSEGKQLCIINLEAATFGKYSPNNNNFVRLTKFYPNFNLNNYDNNLIFIEKKSISSLEEYKYYLLNDQNLIDHSSFIEELSSDNSLMKPQEQDFLFFLEHMKKSSFFNNTKNCNYDFKQQQQLKKLSIKEDFFNIDYMFKGLFDANVIKFLFDYEKIIKKVDTTTDSSEYLTKTKTNNREHHAALQKELLKFRIEHPRSAVSPDYILNDPACADCFVKDPEQLSREIAFRINKQMEDQCYSRL